MGAGFLKIRVEAQFLLRLSGLCLLATSIGYGAAGSDLPVRAPNLPLRMAISSLVLVGVNPGDAQAAMSVWNAELLKSVGVQSARDNNWVMESRDLLAAIRGGNLDLVCLTVPEYRQVAQYLDTGRVMTDDPGGGELLLLVREGGGISRLADLQGRSVIQWETPRTALAKPWLSVAFWHEGLASPEQVLGRMTTSTRLSQVVLPVFFGQADACLVTRKGLDAMVELNPQLSRNLKVLLASPEMVNVFLAFHKNYPVELRKPVFDRMISLNSKPLTRQVLVLFQSPGYTLEDADCLNSANLLFDAYERGREPAPGRKR